MAVGTFLILLFGVSIMMASSPNSPISSEQGESQTSQSEESLRRPSNTSLIAGEAFLSVSRVSDPSKTFPQAAVEAKALLANIIATGDDLLAVHALSAMKWTKEMDLLPAVRTRFASAKSDSASKHVTMGAMAVLMDLSGERFPTQIEAYLSDEDARVRSRAFMLARDSGEVRLLAAVEAAGNLETDPAMQAAANSAQQELFRAAGRPLSSVTLAAMEEEDKISGQERGERRAIIESFTLDPEKIRSFSPEDEEKLRQMAISRQHDERMYAIEMLTLHGSDGIRRWLKGLGDHKDWTLRMSSAYSLLFAGDAKEARNRLEIEDDPLVLVTLLSAVTRQPKQP